MTHEPRSTRTPDASPCAIASLTLIALAGCSSQPAPDPPGQPPGWDQDLALPEAKDTNADPNTVEISLTARVANLEIVKGATTPAWTYDGGIPGPLIHAKRGDRVIVHFTNQLPEPTTVHWHGIRVPNAMDGVPDMPKPAVKPGESFDYDFVVPDAGLFWYHPHVDSSAQVGFGLYGALLVDDPDEPQGLGDPLVLVLSDIGVKPDGSLDAPDAGGALGAVFGREGGTILVNGRHLPKLLARAGRRQRWRIVNAARSRYFWLDTGVQKMTRIGGDGGRTSAPVDLDRLVLAPGERADVLLTPVTSPGEERTVRWIPFDRGYGTADLRPIEDVLTIQASSAAPDVSTAPPDASRAIDPIPIAGAKEVDMKLTMDQEGDKITLGINGVPFDQAKPFPAKIGETQLWTVEDAMPWAHPFHLHGFFFQVLGDDGEPVAPLEWKDTVQVPVDGKVRLAVRFDERPGMWMFHCHILDHADLGMMGMVDLQP
jgi:FtsP/CotA-like multicopper oxidase with cupredoxin domain